MNELLAKTLTELVASLRNKEASAVELMEAVLARIDSTQATIGTGMEIHVISAVIIGGTSLFGGRGTIYGTVVGAILLSMMTNALVIAGVDYFWQLVVMGVIVLIAVAIGNLRERRIPALGFFLRRGQEAGGGAQPRREAT